MCISNLTNLPIWLSDSEVVGLKRHVIFEAVKTTLQCDVCSENTTWNEICVWDRGCHTGSLTDAHLSQVFKWCMTPGRFQTDKLCHVYAFSLRSS